jgi:hypothetical protein
VKTDKSKLVLLFICLVILIVPTHVVGIDEFATIDEPWWVISGSNFYYALTHGDFANTIYDYHPAVTTTWVVTAGMLSYFPEYRGLGQGYFDVRKPHFEEFLRDHGKEAIDLVRNSRLFQTVLLILLALLSFYLLQLLIDRTAAFLGIALAMNAPFFLGHSRLLNHEGLLSMFVLVSVLGLQAYIHNPRRPIHLLVSGAAFGLAQLTKSSSVVLVPLVGWMLFVDAMRPGGNGVCFRIWGAVKSLALWGLAAIFVYVALWPGMWVAPGKMLYEVYGNALSYAFQGARLDVTGELQPSRFNLAANFSSAWGYFPTWMYLSTTVSWLGLIFAVWILVFGRREWIGGSTRSTMAYLVLQAALFMVLFGIARGRDTSHYILSSFVCLDVTAGIGWGYLLLWVRKRWPSLDRSYLKPLFVLILVGVQIRYVLPHYPYYFTYKNTLVTPVTVFGYGEGLELAAVYLAEKPEAENAVAYVYAGMGTFSYFYPGETAVLKKVYLTEPGLPSIIADLEEADYLVLYSAIQKYQPESERFLRVLEIVRPEKIFHVNGWEYARIYRVGDIPPSAFEEMSQ